MADQLVKTYAPDKGAAFILFAKAVSDDGPEFREVLARAGISPAGWASRYARCYAIRNAQHSLKLSQQTLVQWLIAKNPSYHDDLVAPFNAKTGCKWDGFIWPVDLFLAMAEALANFHRNGGEGLHIVCTYRGDVPGGWGDWVTEASIRKYLTLALEGLQSTKLVPFSGDPATIVRDYFVFKRLTGKNQPVNHAKLVIVDDVVCYIGSDNAYPSYTEEFGLWTEDSTALKAFIADYWQGIWKFAQLEG